MYNLNKKLCPNGLGNNPNKPLRRINYITIHTTGNTAPTATAKSHADYVYGGSGGKQTSWHYTVDKDGVWQSFEDNRACWHAGDGNGDGNMESIGIEICVNDSNGFKKACIIAAELTSDLLKKHGLGIDRVVQHNKWSGKDCPKELRSGIWGINWIQFLDNIEKYSKYDGDITLEPAKVKLDPIVINKDGVTTTLNGIVREGVNYVPIRTYEESFGNVVDWIDKVITVDTVMDTVKMLVDGQEFTIPGRNVSGHNYGAIAELLGRMGYDVSWENETVIVNKR